MQKFFKAEQVSANVWWVGAVDWNVRNFHGYLTGRGSTYNAYLIIDDKVHFLGASVKDIGAGLCAITEMQTTPDCILDLIR